MHIFVYTFLPVFFPNIRVAEKYRIDPLLVTKMYFPYILLNILVRETHMHVLIFKGGCVFCHEYNFLQQRVWRRWTKCYFCKGKRFFLLTGFRFDMFRRVSQALYLHPNISSKFFGNRIRRFNAAFDTVPTQFNAIDAFITCFPDIRFNICSITEVNVVVGDTPLYFGSSEFDYGL